MGFRSDIVQTLAKSVLNMTVTKCHMSNYIERDKRPLRRRLITSGLNSMKRSQNPQTRITKTFDREAHGFPIP